MFFLVLVTKKVVTRKDVFYENPWDWNIHQCTPILINNEVDEVVAAPKSTDTSTEAGDEISPQVFDEIDAPDQPLSCSCIRPTYLVD